MILNQKEKDLSPILQKKKYLTEERKSKRKLIKKNANTFFVCKYSQIFRYFV
ncbi:hypothetical protein KUCAC02_002361 [Chaenocephalus aceratus]|uniref:Uncharacterized protein n=1 Tax=Chaenocephalus aceratus TaxID=36190 RepID=A0ACB9XVJ7_CHAAC|nr:hypothetical protein KUCAC02_002361 [Chaenocephalus aceratus]